MELTVKKFQALTLEELYGILRSRSEVFVVEQNIVYQDMDYIDRYSTHIFFKDGDKIASYLRVIDAGVKFKEASIGRVLTLPEYRGRGLSRRLMQLAIQYLKTIGSVPIKIEAQEYLVKFYESLGFKSVSEPFILEDIYHVEMMLY